MVVTQVNKARGYIASGAFDDNRVPQHIQNQIIRAYCVTNNLAYVISRAEYAIEKNNYCQLWAGLKEGYKEIVFYSIWQMPVEITERRKVFLHCQKNNIRLHFACESIKAYDIESFSQIELVISVQTSLKETMKTNYLSEIQNFVDEN